MQKRKASGKLPLDLPAPRVRRRDPKYRGGTKERIDEIDKTASLLRKILVSAVIIILVIALKSIDTDFTQNVVGYIRDGITNDMNIDEALGKLKFVGNYLPDAIAVFGQQSTDGNKEIDTSHDINPFFGIPAEGKVVKQFGQGNKGIDILATKNDNVYAVADGLVIAVGDDSDGGKYIKINHGDDIVTTYEGCSQVTVNIGDNVTKGDEVGTMGLDPSGGYALHFEAWMENNPVDPLKLIEVD